MFSLSLFSFSDQDNAIGVIAFVAVDERFDFKRGTSFVVVDFDLLNGL